MKPVIVLNIEQFEQEESLTDFYSNDLSLHLKKNADIIHKPHKHDFFLCVLFTKGTGKHEIDFNSYSVNPGSLFFLRPGQTHSWEFDTAPSGYIFFHTQAFYEFFFSKGKLSSFPFYNSYNNTLAITIQRPELTMIASYFSAINTEFHQDGLYKRQKLASLLNLLYIDATRLFSNLKAEKKVLSPTYLETLEALENVIEQYYRTEKSAKFFADKLNISTKHLNRITKSTLNKTTTELITERVLLEAKRLIVYSKESLTAISEILGYDDYAYFSRVFKLRTNTTPLEFKKNYRN
ncbi:AraC family transcriptional regulator [Flagellimonas sp. HMM57]|uniref:helix-turn-helix domain-containing protein n=1 Tax=unclassified Flagellimonas TaxID=2644544 RepID=UPI0013D1C08B|nr:MULTISPECIES: helix-turn-helix transcriptional regulator [unclassified Flagellimonas]UII75844.1 AraC family transcriptional regulator [Flagellimonas sp. HMM57]